MAKDFKFKFDPKKLIIVTIDKIVPNNWNPKDKDTKEFENVKKSIEAVGYRDPIVVREYEDGQYQIIDGEQRYTACYLLDYPSLLVYNEGQVSDQKAKELTIWYQQQVPFSKVEEAYLVAAMIDEYQDVELPYSDSEIADMKALANFDFTEYDNNDSQPEPDNNIKTIAIKVEKDKYDFIMNIIHQVTEAEDINEGRALELICADYFSGSVKKNSD